MSSVMGTRQAAELDYAFERNKCDAEFAKWLSQGMRLTYIRDVYEERARLMRVLRVGGGAPFVAQESGIEIVRHNDPGAFEWEPSCVERISIAEMGTTLHDVINESRGVMFANANMLHFMLANYELLPRWMRSVHTREARYVFLGTVYDNHRWADNEPFVRGMEWVRQSQGGKNEWQPFKVPLSAAAAGFQAITVTVA